MINSVGYANPYVYSQKPISFKSQQVPSIATEDKKDGMSNTSKTLLGLGAAAAIIAGGILAKKRIDISKAKSFIQRPEQFEVKDLLKIADNLSEQGKLLSGDRLCMLPKNTVDKFADTKFSNTKWFNIFKNSGMSDNGFVLAIKRDVEGKTKYIFHAEPQLYIEPKNLGERLAFGKVTELPIS